MPYYIAKIGTLLYQVAKSKKFLSFFTKNRCVETFILTIAMTV